MADRKIVFTCDECQRVAVEIDDQAQVLIIQTRHDKGGHETRIELQELIRALQGK